MVQVPVDNRVMVVPAGPFARQTVGVVVVNVTTRPDEAVAPTVSGDWASVFAVSAAKVIVCGTRTERTHCAYSVASAVKSYVAPSAYAVPLPSASVFQPVKE